MAPVRLTGRNFVRNIKNCNYESVSLILKAPVCSFYAVEGKIKINSLEASLYSYNTVVTSLLIGFLKDLKIWTCKILFPFPLPLYPPDCLQRLFVLSCVDRLHRSLPHPGALICLSGSPWRRHVTFFEFSISLDVDGTSQLRFGPEN